MLDLWWRVAKCSDSQLCFKTVLSGDMMATAQAQMAKDNSPRWVVLPERPGIMVIAYLNGVAGFVVSEEDLTVGPKTGLSHSELGAAKFYLKWQDRDSFWHRHQKGVERVPTLISLSRTFILLNWLLRTDKKNTSSFVKILPDPFPRAYIRVTLGTRLARRMGSGWKSLGEIYCCYVIRGTSLEKHVPRRDLLQLKSLA